MKMTYVYPPLFKPFYPIGTRIMTENFLRNEKLEVSFSDVPVRTFNSDIAGGLYDDLVREADGRLDGSFGAFLRQDYMRYNLFYVLMSHGCFNPYILPQVEDEHVALTCINFCDMIIAKHLLEDGKKVVLGGPLVNIGLSPAFVREFLSKMGVDERRLRDNLIVVSGYVDLETDFARLVEEWADADLGCRDALPIYECENDFLQGFYGARSGIPVHLGFNNHCWYGKCKFCTYRKLPKLGFVGESDKDKIAGGIHRLMSKMKANQIRLIDSYYRFDSPVVREVLDEIGAYDITVYTGIKLLKGKPYIEILNRHVNRLLIGLESTSDFSLRYISKGYGRQDIFEAVDCMTRHLDRRIFIELSVILDLPSRDEEDVRSNYSTLERIRRILLQAGFRVAVHMNILSIHPNTELLHADGGLLKIGEKTDENMVRSTGKNYVTHILKQSGLDRASLLPSGAWLRDDGGAGPPLGYLSADLPVMRYDVRGRILPSDLNLIDAGTMKNILTRGESG